MERVRSLTLILSLYFLWNSLLSDPTKGFLGYSHSQMMTYVLGLALLRALVITSRAFELTWEIAQGRLSHLLMRPMDLFAYQLSLDLSDKAVRVASAALEVAVLAYIFDAPLFVAHPASALLAGVSVTLSVLLYFFIGLCMASSGFWSSESVGFLWAAGLLIEFASGAFFPLDVLPDTLAHALRLLPFPYLVYFPLNVYLERFSDAEIAQGLILQSFWVVGCWLAARWIWRIGIKSYQAEGG